MDYRDNEWLQKIIESLHEVKRILTVLEHKD